MTAGLPGVGIGGIFYLLCALLMPIVELVNTLRGRTSKKRWEIVARQFGLLCFIMVGFWITGQLLAIILRKITPYWHLHSSMQQRNILKIQSLFISLIFLVVIFATLHILNYIRDRKKGK